MSDNNFSWRYEVVLNIQGLTYNDVIYFVVYKIPTLHASSFARLSIMLPPQVIYLLKKMVGQSKFPHVNIEIYSPDDKTGERIKTICNKPYRIISILGETKINKPSQHVILQLINPIIYKLSTTHLFDKKFEDKTSQQVLNEYHTFLNDSYGEYFKTRFVCDKNDFFDYEYEETLIYEKSDIRVPFNIINNRCPTKFYPVYFFDDFHFPYSGKNKDINIFYIDYLNLEKHQKAKKLSEYSESLMVAKTEKIIPIGDYNKQLDKLSDNTSKTFIDTANMVAIDDRKEKGKRYKLQTDKENIDITSKKQLKTSEGYVNSKTSLEQSSYEMNITYTDSRENLIDRINKCYNFFKKGPANLHYINTQYGLVDWVHFGYKYALDPDVPEDYRFAPFNIICIFKRELKDAASHRKGTNLKPIWCKYYCKATFFEYIDDEE